MNGNGAHNLLTRTLPLISFCHFLNADLVITFGHSGRDPTLVSHEGGASPQNSLSSSYPPVSGL